MNYKYIQSIILGIILLMCHSCKEDTMTVSHKGVVRKDAHVEILDSVVLNMDSTSMRGNFFMTKGVLYFADTYFDKVFSFRLDDGQIQSSLFGKGNAHNEISNFMYMYPLSNNDSIIFFIDSSNGFFTFSDTSNINKHGIVDFGWKKVKKGDYDSPSVYNIMEMTDFDFKISQINDSISIMPVSLIDRSLGKNASERFKSGHIFASLNMKSMKVENVFGRFPGVYVQKPTNLFDFFSYDMSGDTIFVNHCTDSMVYVYKYPDELLFTMGYECASVDRNYTTGYDIDPSVFEKDIEHVGINTQVYYVKDNGMLLRTVNSGAKYGSKYYLQVYKNCDLVAEEEMPAFFKCIGHVGDTFYGVNIVPIEKEGKETFTLYKFKIR